MDTMTAAAIDREALLRRLRALLPDGSVLHTDEAQRPYECDGLTLFRQLPLATVLPSTEAELLAVVQICREAGVPIVPRGAGTGLSGGATPHAQGVLLSTAKMSRILSIDPLARTARVQPGVRNLAISEAAARYGLYYAPDPSSQIACSIGGNVAENSGGVHCLKYGLTVHNVLRVRAVTIDGEVVEFGHLAEIVQHRGEPVVKERLAAAGEKIGHHQNAGLDAGVAQHGALVHIAHRQPLRPGLLERPGHRHRAVPVGIGLDDGHHRHRLPYQRTHGPEVPGDPSERDF